jgi:hypothetical protein
MADPIQNISLNEFNEDMQYYVDQYCIRNNARYKCIEPTGHQGVWVDLNWEISAPSIVVSTTAPLSPNVGDLWVDTN